jgi:hypothetical protein
LGMPKRKAEAARKAMKRVWLCTVSATWQVSPMGR